MLRAVRVPRLPKAGSSACAPRPRRPVRDIITNLPAVDHHAVLAGDAMRVFPRLAGRKEE
jgi:hypothetical protein